MQRFYKHRRILSVMILILMIAICVIGGVSVSKRQYYPHRIIGSLDLDTEDAITLVQTSMMLSGENQKADTIAYNIIVLLNRVWTFGKYGKNVREVCENAVTECGLNKEKINNTPISDDGNIALQMILHDKFSLDNCSFEFKRGEVK